MKVALGGLSPSLPATAEQIKLPRNCQEQQCSKATEKPEMVMASTVSTNVRVQRRRITTDLCIITSP